ncbi:MAG: type 4a pilus biogenesis protein PilO, partial [Microgenomates group bacterium]
LYHFYQNPIAKVSIELFLSIGLVVFLALFAIQPTLVTMSDLVKEIEEKTELEDALTRKIAALATAQTEYLTLEDRLSVLDDAIPHSPQLVRTIKIIEKAASDNRVVLSAISAEEVPQEISESEEVPFSQLSRQAVVLRVGVVGDYPTIRNFVESLMNSRRSIIVDSVTFSVEENRGSRRLRASIRVSIPYYGKTNAR